MGMQEYDALMTEYRAKLGNIREATAGQDTSVRQQQIMALSAQMFPLLVAEADSLFKRYPEMDSIGLALYGMSAALHESLHDLPPLAGHKIFATTMCGLEQRDLVLLASSVPFNGREEDTGRLWEAHGKQMQEKGGAFFPPFNHPVDEAFALARQAADLVRAADVVAIAREMGAQAETNAIARGYGNDSEFVPGSIADRVAAPAEAALRPLKQAVQTVLTDGVVNNAALQKGLTQLVEAVDKSIPSVMQASQHMEALGEALPSQPPVDPSQVVGMFSQIVVSTLDTNPEARLGVAEVAACILVNLQAAGSTLSEGAQQDLIMQIAAAMERAETARNEGRTMNFLGDAITKVMEGVDLDQVAATMRSTLYPTQAATPDGTGKAL